MAVRTFVDACLLIAAARGQAELGQRAIELLDDPNREFVSSNFVKLEVLPKPIFNGYDAERDFYVEFFDAVATWVKTDEALTNDAFEMGCAAGLSAVDSLHVAAAKSGNAELATAEKPDKPLFRVRDVRVISIHSDTEGS